MGTDEDLERGGSRHKIWVYANRVCLTAGGSVPELDEQGTLGAFVVNGRRCLVRASQGSSLAERLDRLYLTWNV